MMPACVQVLPNMKDWVPYGPAEVDGKPAHMWQLKEMAGEKVNTYTFYVAEVRWRCQLVEQHIDCQCWARLLHARVRALALLSTSARTQLRAWHRHRRVACRTARRSSSTPSARCAGWAADCVSLFCP